MQSRRSFVKVSFGFTTTAPGCLRVSYPTVTFWKNEVAFAHDYGIGGPGELKEGHATKIKIVSLDWLYHT